MSGNIANPRVWTTADVRAGAVGSTAPTDIATSWNAAFKSVGLLHEDGLTIGRTMDTNDIYAYGGILVRTIRSKFKQTFKFTMLEDNLVVFGLVWPGSTAATDTGITTRTLYVPTGANPKAWGLERTDGSITSRLVMPKGEISEVAEIKIADTDVTAYEATVNVYPTSAGVIGTEITNDPQAVVS